jgi:hypothetical protein
VHQTDEKSDDRGIAKRQIHQEARRVADHHHREDYPNSEIIFDGLAWYPDTDPWWSYPDRVVALRGKVAA